MKSGNGLKTSSPHLHELRFLKLHVCELSAEMVPERRRRKRRIKLSIKRYVKRFIRASRVAVRAGEQQGFGGAWQEEIQLPCWCPLLIPGRFNPAWQLSLAPWLGSQRRKRVGFFSFFYFFFSSMSILSGYLAAARMRAAMP